MESKKTKKTRTPSELTRLKKELAALKAKEKALLAENQFLRELYDRSPLGYQSLDEKGRFIEVNQAWLDTLGYERSEVIGKNFGDFLHPDWKDHFKENFPKFKALGEILGVEFEMVRKDGTIIMVSFNGKIGRDSKGRFQQTYCVFQDITERKEDEARLRRLVHELEVHQIELEMQNVELRRTQEELDLSHTAYVDLYDFAPVGYFTLDPQGLIEKVNLTGASLLGIERRLLVKKNFSGFIADAVGRMIFSKYREAVLQKQGDLICEIKLKRKDDTTFYAQLQSTTVKSDGKAGSIRTTVIDISEQKKAEDTLRQNESLLKAILNASPETIALLDTDGTILMGNEAMARRLKHPFDQVLGRNAYDFLPPKVAENRRKYARQVIETGLPVSFVDERDGLILESHIYPVLNTSGKVVQQVIFALDITSRKQAETALLEREEQLQSIASSIPGAIYQFVRRLDGRIEIPFMSEGGRLLFDRPVAELQDPARLFDDVHPEDVPGLWASIEASAKNLTPWVTEFRLVPKTASLRWLRGASNPHRLSDGGICWCGVLLDITEQKLGDEQTRLQHTLAQSLNAASDLQQGLRLCLETALQGSGLDAGGFYLMEETSGGLDLWVPQGLSPDFIEAASRFEAPSDQARLIMAGLPTYAGLEDLGLSLSEDERREGLRSVAVIPLRHEGKVIGCMNVASHSADDIPPANRQVLETIAATATQAIVRLRAEERLRASEIRFRFLVDHTYDLIWTLTSDSVFSYASPSWKTRLGYEPSSVVDKAFQTFVHPDDVTACEDYLARILAAQSALPGPEYRVRHVDGSWRWHEASMTPVYAQDGSFQYFVGVSRDITKRKLAEAALKASESRFKGILQNVSTVAVQGYALDGTVRYWNRASETFYGFTAEEAHGRNLLELIVPPEMRDEIQANIHHMSATGKVLPSAELVLMRKDGSRIPVYSSHALVQVPGQDLEFFCIDTDLTDRKKAEESLRQSRADYKSLVDNMQESVSILDSNGTFLFANPVAAKNLTGSSSQDLIGKSIRRVLPKEQAERLMETYRRTLDSGQKFTQEILVSLPQGERWFYNTLHPMRYGSGQVKAVLSISLDITERKQTEKALQASKDLLNATQELAKVGGWEWDVQTQTMTWTDETYRIHGIDSQEVNPGSPEHIQKSLACYDPSDRPFVQETFQRCLELGQAYDLELPFTSMDGRRLWIRTAAKPVMKDKSVVRVIGNIMDITQRKLAEESSRKTNLQLSLALSSAQAGIWDWDMTSNTLSWSPELFQLFGLGLEAGASFDVWQSLLHPDDRQKAEDRIKETIRDRKRLSNEYRIITPSGEIRWINALGDTQYAKNGQAERMSGICFDITERKQAEQLLHLQAMVLDQIQDAVTVTDLQGVITYVNQAEANKFKKTREELIGRHVEIYGQDPVRGATQQEIVDTTLAQGEWRGEVVNFDAQGRPFIIDCRTSLIRDESGQAIGMCGIGTDITERRRMEDALRDSREKFKAIADYTVDWESWFGIDGTCLWVNPAVEEVTGYTPEEILSMPDFIQVIIHEEDRPMVAAGFQGAILGSFGKGVAFRCIRKDGKEIWISASWQPIFDSQGRPLGTRVSCRDISERKRAEAELLRSEKKWRNIIAKTPQIGITLDPQASVIFANAHFLKLTGWKEREIIGKNWFDLFIPEPIREEIRQVFVSFSNKLDSLDYSTYENDILTKTGDLRNISWANVANRDSQGNFLDFTCLGIDLTERKKAEEVLRESEATLHRALKISKLGPWKFDVQNDLFLFNDQFYSLYHTTAEQEGGYTMPSRRYVERFVHPDDQDAVQKAVRKALANTDPNYTLLMEHRIVCADGEIKHIIVHVRADRDAQGRVTKTYGANQDITERKLMENTIKASLAEKEVLLREVHHRVKNNLAAIIGLLDLQRQAMNEPKAQAILSELSSRIRSMSLIHEKLYRSESLSEIDFQDYSQNLVSHLRTSFGTRDIQCSINAKGVSLPLDLAVPCGMILNEIVTNALKYAFPKDWSRPDRDECRIEISLTKDQGVYTLTVADNGVGFPQGFDWTKTKSLGLVLVRMLGEHQLGGRCELHQGQGTKLTLTFDANRGGKKHD